MEKMSQIEVDSDTLWALYDEKENKILYVFTNREDALFKMADYDEVSSLQISKIARTEEGWDIDCLSWKELVVDLIKKANKSVEYMKAPQIPQL